MAKLPKITGAQAIAAFQRAGFTVARQSSSHVILKRSDVPLHLSIPIHGHRTIGAGLLRTQIRLAGMTVEEFCELL